MPLGSPLRLWRAQATTSTSTTTTTAPLHSLKWPVSHNEAGLNSLPGDKLAKASSGVLIEKGCYILGYENAQCNGNAVNMTWTNATDCFTLSSDDAHFQAFQLMNCD
ncbi:hypothetical protein DPV78_011567 [Talaromyces pinophilus]|nr:hypothetical protein DPV78_011567 [Talaromyces pinophilus]